MAGLKIMTAPTCDGKIAPDDIDGLARALGDIHSAQPAIVSISNTTERGTFYTADEIGALTERAHANGMLVHIDGARIFNANVSAGYSSTADAFTAMYGDTGVDVISLGGTKTGAISAEAVVILHPENSELARGAKFSQKQMGQLSSKARYNSAQFLALFEDELAHKLATHGNDMMKKFYAKFVEATGATVAPKAFLSGATSAYASGNDELIGDSMHYFEDDLNSFSYQGKPDANAFFPSIPDSVVNQLRESYHFYNINAENRHTTIRLMTSFATTDQHLDDFITTLKGALPK
jgi:threonine aldolase